MPRSWLNTMSDYIWEGVLKSLASTLLGWLKHITAPVWVGPIWSVAGWIELEMKVKVDSQLGLGHWSAIGIPDSLAFRLTRISIVHSSVFRPLPNITLPLQVDTHREPHVNQGLAYRLRKLLLGSFVIWVWSTLLTKTLCIIWLCVYRTHTKKDI